MSINIRHPHSTRLTPQLLDPPRRPSRVLSGSDTQLTGDQISRNSNMSRCWEGFCVSLTFFATTQTPLWVLGVAVTFTFLTFALAHRSFQRFTNIPLPGVHACHLSCRSHPCTVTALVPIGCGDCWQWVVAVYFSILSLNVLLSQWCSYSQVALSDRVVPIHRSSAAQVHGALKDPAGIFEPS